MKNKLAMIPLSIDFMIHWLHQKQKVTGIHPALWPTPIK